MKNDARSGEKVRLMCFSVECEDVNNSDKKQTFHRKKGRITRFLLSSLTAAPYYRMIDHATALNVGDRFVT